MFKGYYYHTTWIITFNYHYLILLRSVSIQKQTNSLVIAGLITTPCPGWSPRLALMCNALHFTMEYSIRINLFQDFFFKWGIKSTKRAIQLYGKHMRMQVRKANTRIQCMESANWLIGIEQQFNYIRFKAGWHTNNKFFVWIISKLVYKLKP